MDPNSIIKLVREQRRQINDSFNPNINEMHKKDYENTLDQPNSMHQLTYNQTKTNQASFLLPSSRHPVKLINQSHFNETNDSIFLVNDKRPYGLSGGENTTKLSLSNQNINSEFTSMESIGSIRTKDNNSHFSNSIKMMKYNSDCQGSLSEQQSFQVKQSDLNNFGLESHSSNSENLSKQAFFRNKIQKENSTSSVNTLVNENINNSSQINYHFFQSNGNQHFIKDSINRSASAKSLTSDSGVGSSSPLSDCSETSNNMKLVSSFNKPQTNNKLLQGKNKMSIEMNSSSNFITEDLNRTEQVINNAQINGRKRKIDAFYEKNYIPSISNTDSTGKNVKNHDYNSYPTGGDQRLKLTKHLELHQKHDNNDLNAQYNSKSNVDYLAYNKMLQQQNQLLINQNIKHNFPYQMSYNQTIPSNNSMANTMFNSTTKFGKSANECNKECCSHLHPTRIHQQKPTQYIQLNKQNNIQYQTHQGEEMGAKLFNHNHQNLPQNLHKLSSSFQLSHSNTNSANNGNNSFICDCNECNIYYLNNFYLKPDTSSNSNALFTDHNNINNNNNSFRMLGSNTSSYETKNGNFTPNQSFKNGFSTDSQQQNNSNMYCSTDLSKQIAVPNKEAYSLIATSPMPTLFHSSQENQNRIACACNDCIKANTIPQLTINKPNQFNSNNQQVYNSLQYQETNSLNYKKTQSNSSAMLPIKLPSNLDDQQVLNKRFQKQNEPFINIQQNKTNQPIAKRNINKNYLNENSNSISNAYQEPVVQQLTCEYNDLIKNGIQITKQKNIMYINNSNENENMILLNDSKQVNSDQNIKQNDNNQLKVSQISKNLYQSKNNFEDSQIDNININLITQAKQTTPSLKQNKEIILLNNDVQLANKPQNRSSTDSLSSISSTSSLASQSTKEKHRITSTSVKIPALSITSQPTSIVCLSVSNNSSDDDFELGEVVRIDKLKNTANVEILSNNNPTAIADALKPAVTHLDDDVPVMLSKKILPIITPRIHDWLEKCVEFSIRIKFKTNLSLNSIFLLLSKAWPRLLLAYMIENSFDFCVTKDNHQIALLESTNDNVEKTNLHATISKLPKEKDTIQLHNIITKGNNFNLNSLQYDQLREIIFFKEGGEDAACYKIFMEAHKSLQESIESTHSKQQFSKLLLFLPSIYNIKIDLIDSLFCSNFNDFKNVYEFLRIKLGKTNVNENDLKEII